MAQITADYEAARAALRSYKNDRGQPFITDLGTAPDLIAVVPPALEGPARRLATSELVGGGDTNPWAGSLTVQVDVRLTDSDDWYLDYVGRPIRGFIMQEREAPELVSLDMAQASERVFLRDEFLYGVRARHEAGYGLWQMSVKIGNS